MGIRAVTEKEQVSVAAIHGLAAADRLGLEKIPSDSIHLTPALFKK